MSSKSYTTTSLLKYSKLIKEVKANIIKSTYSGVNNEDLFSINENISIVIGSDNTIAPFNHPIVINDKPLIVTDIRPYINNQGKIRNINEYNFNIQRCKLDAEWESDRSSYLSQVDIVVDFFSTWFSNGLSSKVNTDLITTNAIKIISSVYYLSLMSRESTVTLSRDEIEIMLLKVLSRILKIPSNLIDEVLSADIDSIIDLYSVDVSTAVRFDMLISILNEYTNNGYSFNKTLIYNALTKGAFISVNSAEVVAVSMEHVPLMTLLIHHGLVRHVQGRGSIARTVNSIKRKHEYNGFINFMNKLTNKEYDNEYGK